MFRPTMAPEEKPLPPETITQTGSIGAPHLVPRNLDATALKERDSKRYEFIGEYARGGLGRVMRTRDMDLGREIAIKEMLSPGGIGEARFVREALITARLEHPGIVPVHEAGRWPDGTPFYAMKLVSGRPLKDLLQQASQFEARLALLPNVIAVSDAIAYAHDKGIIHRDLKPANIIVGEFGETVVIDWGLAKDLRAQVQDAPDAGPYRSITSSDVTMDGTVLGTPAYMAPEQAAGAHVDERSDVYALGAMLYHLLAASPPFSGSTSAEVLAQVLRGPPTDIQERQPGSPLDLAAIVRKAMARSPSERYSNARALVEDLRRFQTGQIVSAHRYSAAEVIKRWVRRHKAAVLVATASFFVLVIGGTLSVRSIARERNNAVREKQQTASALERERHAKNVAEVRTNKLLIAESEKLLTIDPTQSITILTHVTEPFNDAILAVMREAQARGYARFIYRRRTSKDAVRFSSTGDGRLVALAGDTLQVWHLETRHLIMERPLNGHVTVLRFAPDGASLAIGYGDGLVELLNVVNGTATALHKSNGTIYDLSFSRDGQLLACGDVTGLVRVLDTHSQEVLVSNHFHDYVALVRFSGSNHLLTSSGSGEIAFFNPSTATWRLMTPATTTNASAGLIGNGEAVGTWDGRHVTICRESAQVCQVRDFGTRDGTALFLPRSSSLALCAADGHITILNYDTGIATTLYKSDQAINCGAVSSDGRYLLGSRGDGTVVESDTTDGASYEYRGHGAGVIQVGFLGDTRFPVSTAVDGSLRIWTRPVFPQRILDMGGAPLQYAAFSPLQDSVMVRATDGSLALWPQADRPPLRLKLDSQAIRSRYAPDQSAVYTVQLNGHFNQIEPKTGVVQLLAVLKGYGSGLEVSPSGRFVVAAASKGQIAVWDSEQRHVSILEGNHGAAYYLLFSLDERFLISGSNEGEVRRWDLLRSTSELLYVHGHRVSGLEWVVKGRRIITASDDGSVRTYDIETKQHSLVKLGTVPIARFISSPDGQYISAIDKDRMLQVWTSSGVLILTANKVASIAFPARTRRAAIGYESGVVSIIDLTRRVSDISMVAHKGSVPFISFSEDTDMFVSAGTDGVAKVWSFKELDPTPNSQQLSDLVVNLAIGGNDNGDPE